MSRYTLSTQDFGNMWKDFGPTQHQNRNSSVGADEPMAFEIPRTETDRVIWKSLECTARLMAYSEYSGSRPNYLGRLPGRRYEWSTGQKA